MMTHKELIAKMRSQSKYKEKYDEAAPEFELLRKRLKLDFLLIANGEEKKFYIELIPD